METWILYAIFSAIFAGLYSFTLKLVAQYHLSPEKTIFYSSVGCLFLTSAFAVIEGLSFMQWEIVAALAFINGSTYYVAVFTRIHSLRYIHTTIYFPIYKTLGPIFVTVLGVTYFRDDLTIYEIIGILLGIIVPLLLISKSEDARQKNLKKGLWFLLIGAVMTTATAAAGKYLNMRDLDQLLYLLFSFIFYAIISGITTFRGLHKDALHKKSYFKRIIICATIFQFAGFYSFVQALEGDLSVAFTINAFSIIIPIVLSVWFFREHMNFRKAFVIFMSIVSIIFFTF